MNDSPVLESNQVSAVASDAATQLDNAFLGREASFESVTQIIEWLHEEACQLRRRMCTHFSPLAMRELVAPEREDITHVDELAAEIDSTSRWLRQTLMGIHGGHAELAAEARDFVLKLYALSYQQAMSRRGRRFLFA